MPAKSKAQQRLMAAAEHGATFGLAKQLRETMTTPQLHDFATGSMATKPEHVKPAKAAPAAAHPHKNLGPYLHPKKGK